MRTEDRPAPPSLAAGTRLVLGSLKARVVEVLPPSPRLLRVAFEAQGAALWTGALPLGRPVQYSYLSGPLALWHIQTAYAARPWAAEAPSAGLPLTWAAAARAEAPGRALRLAHPRRGPVLHWRRRAGCRAAPPGALRASPPATVEAIRATRAAGGRVVAVGTTVVRALEGRAAQDGGTLTPGEGVTDLLMGPGFVPKVVNGLLTGVHEPYDQPLHAPPGLRAAPAAPRGRQSRRKAATWATSSAIRA